MAAADEEPLYDVTVNVHKDAKQGYGIYFTQRNGTIVVTKLDPGSEAEAAGVQERDILVSVKDLDNVVPAESPGMEVIVTTANYQPALQLVRTMKYAQLRFRSPGFGD